jgi:NTE family protein
MDATTTRTEARQILVLQGGGALGSYQAGVYEGLCAAALAPDWVAGISIGAVNAAIIAGNPPERRLERLRSFWELTSSGSTARPLGADPTSRAYFNEASAAWIAMAGVPGFFKPRMVSPFFYPPGAPEALSFYDTTPLKETLEALVDFELLNSGKVRLSVGAVDIRKGTLRFFDNARERIGPEHIMASGALPPGLPPVEIDGRFYWDGGLVSNTPLDYVLQNEQVEDMAIFQVDLFNSAGQMPRTILESAEREKEIRFASRRHRNTESAMQLHRTKVALRDLIAKLPEDLMDDPEIQVLDMFARENSVTIVQLIYRGPDYETSSKDYEFSRATMLDHWAAGLNDARRTLRDRHKILCAKPGGGAIYDSRDPETEADAPDRPHTQRTSP